MKIFKYDIRLNTVFKKGLPKLDDRFGVWYVTGKQGSGKSYLATFLTLMQDKKLINKVYTNIHSLNIPDYDIEYFTKLEDIYFNTDEYCIFLIDELARRYNKSSKTDTQFYGWLNQSRKRKRIVIMITQEWRELPMWIRRPAKYMFTTYKTPILYKLGFVTTSVGDAENLIFDKDESEYICPPIKYIVYRRNEDIAKMYDTFEAINEL